MAKITGNVTVTLTLNEYEASMLKALCQNPHDAYQENSDLMAFARNTFETLKEILGPSSDLEF